MQSTINMVDAAKMIVACFHANEPLLLLGEPGMGKTSMYEAITVQEKIGFIDNRLTQKDPVDVGGMRIPDERTGILRHFVPEDLPVVEDNKNKTSRFPAKGILLYDEINVVSMLMQATAYGIIQERRVGQKRIMPGWVPMASGNNMTDRSAAQRISLALANRFNVQRVKPDVQSWLRQYGSQHVDARGTAFLQFRPECFHVMPDSSNPETRDEVRFPTARSWTKAFKFIGEEPVFRKKIISGYVGDVHAEEFESFWRIMEKATPFDEIVADPIKARIPEERDAGTYYAVTGMIARSMTRKNIDPVMIYVDRMLPEYQTALLQDATRREPTLKNTQAYGNWALKHQEIHI